MPDIFLSYNREDQARAEVFAKALEGQGFDVWWDVGLRTGEAYDKVTEDALRGAKAVVVLWSKRSVESRWVRAEATLADRNKTLVPCMIEPCERPIMFELTQTADLAHWRGEAADRTWQAFLADVKRFVGREPTPAQGIPAAPTALLDQRGIVVLPFANMSRDEDQEYFADGITEDVITDLSKVSALKVIARNTAFTFKGKAVDVRDVARQLNVTHVLEGSVRKAGNRVRVTAQLIDGLDSSHVWAHRWDRDLDDIFALQDELSQAIVEALKVKLSPDEKEAITERETHNADLYDMYLRARAVANTADSAETYAQALRLYQDVLAADSTFLPAVGGMVSMLHQRSVFSPDLRQQNQAQIQRLLEPHRQLHVKGAAAHLIDATFQRWRRNWAGALQAYEHAVAAAPAHDPEIAFVLGTCLISVGRVTEAIALGERTRVADPYSGTNTLLLQIAYQSAGRADEGEAEYRRSFSFPTNRQVCEDVAWFRMWPGGDLAAVRAQFQRYVDVCTVPMPFLQEYCDALEQPGEAVVILRRAFDDPRSHNCNNSFLIGLRASLHGAYDLAAAAIRRAAAIDPAMDWTLWLSSRDFQRTEIFKELVRELGIYDCWSQTGNWGDFARPLGEDDFEIIA
ncbi:MAG: TIR domain-containing protein [Hyphomonadaceae bacterium]